MWRSWHLRSNLKAVVCAVTVMAAVSASATEGETTFGAKALYGYLVSGLENSLQERHTEEAVKRIQPQELMELTERTTSAEKDSLRDPIARVESAKRTLAEGNDGLGQKLASMRPLRLPPAKKNLPLSFEELLKLRKNLFQGPFEEVFELSKEKAPAEKTEVSSSRWSALRLPWARSVGIWRGIGRKRRCRGLAAGARQ